MKNILIVAYLCLHVAFGSAQDLKEKGFDNLVGSLTISQDEAWVGRFEQELKYGLNGHIISEVTMELTGKALSGLKLPEDPTEAARLMTELLIHTDLTLRRGTPLHAALIQARKMIEAAYQKIDLVKAERKNIDEKINTARKQTGKSNDEKERQEAARKNQNAKNKETEADSQGGGDHQNDETSGI